MTRNEICLELVKRGWFPKYGCGMWVNLNHPKGRTGLTLREAASLEALTSTEDLTERPKK
jgi:hypothetical protein